MSHPLDGYEIKLTNFKSFGEESPYVPIQPINILIGKNNSGKSSLFDALEILSGTNNTDTAEYYHKGAPYLIGIKQIADEHLLRQIFSSSTEGGAIIGNHWTHGQNYIGKMIEREYEPRFNLKNSHFPAIEDLPSSNRADLYYTLNARMGFPLKNAHLFKVAAERNVAPEQSKGSNTVSPDGTGLTNAIRAFLNQDRLDRDEVDVNILQDLNKIYEGDRKYRRIVCRENDQHFWEIFLEEESQSNLIRLSRSGSSLKSIFTILATLRLNPIINEVNLHQSIFFLEEPENNLHPSLLRRLLNFLADLRRKHNITLFITTHSPICIDWASRREDSGITHIVYGQNGSIARPATDYSAMRNILDDLDFRASEILQANGVIWVEGPSDRIYLRKWIDLYSEGELKEDIHYTIMFYGGKLLSHLSAQAPEEADGAISLLRLNRNAAVVIDSDKKKTGGSRTISNINKTKKRIKAEIERNNGISWITDGKEIENYLPESLISAAIGKTFNNKDMYSNIFNKRALAEYKNNKVKFSELVTNIMKPEHLENPDLKSNIDKVCKNIRRWNGL